MPHTKPIKAVITDDSPHARKLLRLMLAELAPEIEVCRETENVAEGLKAIKESHPDVVFLDIEMPGRTGLQMAEELISSGIDCKVVFTTAYNAYAIKAFRLSAIDYLLKPIQEDQLLEAVQKLKELRKQKDTVQQLEVLSKNLSDEKPVLNIPVQGGYEYVPLNEIEYLEADGSYVHVHCINDRTRTVSKNLKYFETALSDNPNFVRPHRSFLVNTDHITNYLKTDGGCLVLRSDAQIPVSRERKQAIQEILK